MSSERHPIRFRFAAVKAWQAIRWMLAQAKPGRLDLHTILKACYFADVEHLNRHGRPVFGATYRAMRFGPVPLEIYEMLKCEPIWLSELAERAYPWALVHGYDVQEVAGDNLPVSCDDLSASDMQALDRAFQRARGMSFSQRTAATHGPDWQKAVLGMMQYEDMLAPDLPGRDALIAELRANGSRLVL